MGGEGEGLRGVFLLEQLDVYLGDFIEESQEAAIVFCPLAELRFAVPWEVRGLGLSLRAVTQAQGNVAFSSFFTTADGISACHLSEHGRASDEVSEWSEGFLEFGSLFAQAVRSGRVAHGRDLQEGKSERGIATAYYGAMTVEL